MVLIGATLLLQNVAHLKDLEPLREGQANLAVLQNGHIKGLEV